MRSATLNKSLILVILAVAAIPGFAQTRKELCTNHDILKMLPDHGKTFCNAEILEIFAKGSKLYVYRDIDGKKLLGEVLDLPAGHAYTYDRFDIQIYPVKPAEPAVEETAQ